MTFKNYADPLTVCGKALAQMSSAMKMPWAVKGALMPDTHAGYALPIGAVVATKDVVVPAWVGYDIGCGMCAYKMDFYNPDSIKDNLSAIYTEIAANIPVGFKGNTISLPVDTSGLTQMGKQAISKKNPGAQLGTLGGGNHFIELGLDESNELWCIIHSGSRGVGHALATHYMKLAGGGKAREDHCPLSLDTVEGKSYMQDLAWGLKFALDNRATMMQRVLDSIATVLGVTKRKLDKSTMINRNHNHAEIKDGLVIHRKGATHAEYGMMGVIPGNMQDGSFIVKGKGNPEALFSSSHGAGRVLSRTQAKAQVNIEEFKKSMVGIATGDLQNLIDEAPEAYKNIFDVMDMQKDLVEVVAHVKPILNLKG